MIYRSESRQQSINKEHTSIVMTITEKSSARAGMTEGCGKDGCNPPDMEKPPEGGYEKDMTLAATYSSNRLPH